MTMDRDFLSMMNTTVLVSGVSSRDAYGKSTYRDPIGVRAWVRFETRLVRRINTEDIQSYATLSLPPPGMIVGGVTTPTLTTSDTIQLPGDTTLHPVVSVSRPTDEDGTIHHQKVTIA